MQLQLGERELIGDRYRIPVIDLEAPPRLELEATQTPTTQPFQTNNWDTVFSASFTQMNQYILAESELHPENYPTAWSATVPPSGFSEGYSGSGTFQPWQLDAANPDSGEMLMMNWQIPTCTVTLADGTTYNVTNAVAQVEVSLVAVSTEGSTSTPGPVTKAYMLNTQGTATLPVATVLTVTYETPTPPVDGLDGAIKNLLATWAQSNIGEFKHVFATITLDQQASPSSFQWLVPTTSAYAYNTSGNPDTSYFAVLGMVDNHSSASTALVLDAGSVPVGQQACYNLAQDTMMQEMILPNLAGQFPAATADTFVYENHQIVLAANTTLNIGTVKVGLINYDQILESFNISVNGSQLVVYSYVHTPISPGIDAYVENTAYYNLTLGTSSTGTQSITYTVAQPPLQRSWSETATWVIITEAIADLILAVIGAVIGAVVSSTLSTTLRVIVAIVAGGVLAAVTQILEETPVWIAGSVPDTLPAIDVLFNNAAGGYKWTDTANFKLTTVGLNGSLQMSGQMIPN
ncbi:TULIP family P47-like protein [Deinococcus sp. Leaf326]|uniref:TULIP family P47-like protein n=1 Tax=Deinococcus sp. Leaf326 TaxID=1736338 RepID=UPI0009E87C29|nr:TULIP family P47-like protein [Deinococcus sp. Leaf326]